MCGITVRKAKGGLGEQGDAGQLPAAFNMDDFKTNGECSTTLQL